MHWILRNLAPVEFPGIDIAYGLSPSPVRDRKHTLTSNIFGSSASQWTKMILERTWNKLHYSFFTAHDCWSASTHTSASVGIWSKGISTSLSRCKFHIFRYRVLRFFTICNTECMVFILFTTIYILYLFILVKRTKRLLTSPQSHFRPRPPPFWGRPQRLHWSRFQLPAHSTRSIPWLNSLPRKEPLQECVLLVVN